MGKLDEYSYVYCLLCRYGAEIHASREIEKQLNNSVKVLISWQEKHKSINGHRKIVRQLLLPRYLFLYAKERVNFEYINQIEYLYQILKNGDGTIELQGSDRSFADWLWMNEGLIDISRLHFEGGQLNIISGPIMYFVNRIIKVDKHTKNVLVQMNFQGKRREMWLAFDWSS